MVKSKTRLFVLINSLPNDKFVDWWKLKAFADDKEKKLLKNWNSNWEGYKTLWEKEEMLVTSFSFSLSVF